MAKSEAPAPKVFLTKINGAWMAQSSERVEIALEPPLVESELFVPTYRTDPEGAPFEYFDGVTWTKTK